MQLNLDDTGGARELAVYRFGAAKEDLEVAQLNFDSGHYRASNNRAYYAIFRAISACLALEFKAYKQHAQVIGNFNKILCIPEFSLKKSVKKSAGRKRCVTPVTMMIFILFL